MTCVFCGRLREMVRQRKLKELEQRGRTPDRDFEDYVDNEMKELAEKLTSILDPDGPWVRMADLPNGSADDGGDY